LLCRFIKLYLQRLINYYMRKILLITLFAIILAGCKKNDSTPKPVDPNGPDDNSKTDKLLVESVTTTYSDGSYIIDYNYDAKNHLVKMNSHTTGNTFDDVADHVYTYDNQDNLTKSVITRSGDVSIFDYTYQNGIPTAVTYSQPNHASQGHTIDITTNGGVVTGNTIHTPSGESATVLYNYTDNNKLVEMNKSFDAVGNLTFTLSFNDEYGVKKNPYLYTGNKWVLPDVPFANKNELLKETVSNNGPMTVYTYKNTYNQQGYPTTVETTMYTAAGITNSTITYTYITIK
jgi:hypothetical protein